MFRKGSLGPIKEKTKSIPLIRSSDSKAFEKKHKEVRKAGSIKYF
ncbi:MAG: hypothetical protein ACRCVG_07100 [Methanobacteriaceae archaeon]